ncbi:IS1634 family transposase [Moorella sulfitireducens]|uniref:IS1634 family transposase n=1 Tax=Neomoorella sulfitireducens TaxID=2972948 RepID=UPI0021ABC454|nr:IS1634 family transposase [Moorella sulfitireducens]
MFIKITKSRDYQYVQLVQSYRENGVVKHKVLLNLGRLEEIENNPSFQRLGKRLLELSKAREVTSLANFSEAQIKNWGYVVYQKIWNQLELPKLLKKISAKRKVQFDLNDASFLMAVQHLLEPRSKLGTYNHQHRYASLPDVALNHLYRSLDLLCEHKELLEEEMFQKNRHLFNMQVDVVFYDVTTFSFASVEADSLRDFGFSKDGKFNEVQVVLGLLIDCEGRPIGYELFPGNTFDGKTLEAALEKLEKRFGLRRVIIVADRGINSKLNLKRIVERGYSYIFAARIKSMKKEITDVILDDDGYQEITDDEEEVLRYKVIEYINEFTAEGKKYKLPEKLVITYSSRRAEKDRADRERLIEKAQTLLESKAKIQASNKRGGKKYLKEVDCTGTWVLDEEAIARDKQFDGYYGIQTSEKEMSAKDILDAYHNLWRIEESFRVMKSTLEVRPVFHWTERRIKGHFVICFLAFLLERTLEFKLRQAGDDASPEKIREALNSLNFAEVEIEGEAFFIKTRSTELSKKLLRLMRIAPPGNVTRVKEFAARWQCQQ